MFVVAVAGVVSGDQRGCHNHPELLQRNVGTPRAPDPQVHQRCYLGGRRHPQVFPGVEGSQRGT